VSPSRPESAALSGVPGRSPAHVSRTRASAVAAPDPSPPAAISRSSPAPSLYRTPPPPMLPRSSSVRRCAESDKRPGPAMVRTTCRTISFSGMSTHSICPLTGRVGNECGEICPAQAQRNHHHARRELRSTGPYAHTLPSATSTASISSPDENSTRDAPRGDGAAVSCRGSTQRSFTKKPAESFARNAGSNSSSGLGRAEPGPCPVFLLTKSASPPPSNQFSVPTHSQARSQTPDTFPR